ncbi:LPS translocon maturation chaperone LptM [Acidithiobacillus thiooxidans]|uniref:Lipoprotein n=1 Tax=Acidithiobacillus thiooxidans ATCC 19377 TaxID=637390 RepID=A0A543Q058_ACITH|nr:lipoprotein [Acidithiobacillus thiooxidans]MDX5936324.1 lipoprotein [Acidithiobacillus thiooxidans]TQN49680.1 hypothetical protein DLNHIDIE_03090 [Acidithiobacillus thiooxidans ATCC 19377]
MKSLATVAFAGVLVLGLAGCGRKTPLSLPPPPPAHPAANAAASTVVPAQSDPAIASTGSAEHP